MTEKAFGFMDIPHRPGKPRESGLTMMIDWGLGVTRQRDILEIAGEYIDIAKIAVGLSGIIPKKILQQKIGLYREYQVDAFIGGQFLEYAVYHQGLDAAREYFLEAEKLGYNVLEISDNNLEISAEDKANLIRMGSEDYGFRILGEVGSKKEMSSQQAMAEGIRSCLEAGAWKVFVEGAEFTSKTDGTLRVEVIEGITKNIDVNNILFELPGKWISNVHHCGIHDIEVFLVVTFGPAVNIANVAPDDILELEALRTGVGVKLG